MKSILKSILWITGIISGLIMIGARVYAIWGDWMLGIEISLVSGTVTAACYLILVFLTKGWTKP